MYMLHGNIRDLIQQPKQKKKVSPWKGEKTGAEETKEVIPTKSAHAPLPDVSGAKKKSSTVTHHT